MITVAEYKEVALSVELEALKPVLLNAEELRAKLDELGIEASSKLGRYALGGGRLSSRDGIIYQLDTAAAKAMESKAQTARPSNGLTLLDRVADVYCGGGVGVEPPRTHAPQPSPEESSTLLTFAGIYCGTDEQGMQATAQADNTLLDRAADAWLGTSTHHNRAQ